jgi:hypothetical protein
MKFFSVVGFTLFLIAFFNLVDVGVQMSMKDRVYSCSEVSYPRAIDIPQEVIKLCRKANRQ